MNNRNFDVFYVYINTDDDFPFEKACPHDSVVIRRSNTTYLLFVTVCGFDELEKSAENVLKQWEKLPENAKKGKAVFYVYHVCPFNQGIELSSKLIKTVSDSGLSLRYLRNRSV